MKVTSLCKETSKTFVWSCSNKKVAQKDKKNLKHLKMTPKYHKSKERKKNLTK